MICFPILDVSKQNDIDFKNFQTSQHNLEHNLLTKAKQLVISTHNDSCVTLCKYISVFFQHFQEERLLKQQMNFMIWMDRILFLFI